jgi:hypothetical protein
MTMAARVVLSGWQGLVLLLPAILATPLDSAVLADAQPAALLAPVSYAVVLALHIPEKICEKVKQEWRSIIEPWCEVVGERVGAKSCQADKGADPEKSAGSGFPTMESELLRGSHPHIMRSMVDYLHPPFI